MSEYIDLKKLKDVLREDTEELADGWTWKEIWEEQERMIDERIPIEDVVPVVRCKDCSRQCICYHSADYYCADGEKVAES